MHDDGSAVRALPDARGRDARRAVLDHLLGLVADSPLSETLVLRGSAVMPAWVGDAAREPADLDWIVPGPWLLPVDTEHPYPYVDEVAAVQQWPEAADGAGRYEIWTFEEFDTRGARPVVPPEGLHWITEAEPETHAPHETLLDLVRERPTVAPGLVLDPDAAREDGTWTYAAALAGYDAPGVRLALPWQADGHPPGEVRLDFARDEWLPEPPVWTAIPRADGSGPTVLRTASRELSLAWKLLWLHADSAAAGRARAKDLHDAVLLAETAAAPPAPDLLRRVFRREPGRPAAGGAPRLDAVLLPAADWAQFRASHPRVRGSAEEWLARLRRALER
ncbi:nucleotidyl transferase AbiEii/AbiGii toxin family protein [Kitasatospora cheerisanensis]|uniref:nucleotidyl transferase AbiEii/AbiGii toxin family protein n=1 Tax=Kitasatospora cheerisanensis TaxID=81942 RepID=UPI001FCC02A1|nr:nucleotidyl transferase AbiEii/AbiGii toxin family protein [Kitasatospora cheerisanensis]